MKNIIGVCMEVRQIKAVIESCSVFKDNWKFRLLAQWPTIIGSLNTQVALEKINNESIVLGVVDSCWMQELYLLTPTIKSLINKSLDIPRIHNIYFRKKSVSKENGRTVQKVQKKTFHHTPPSYKEINALNQITDTELKELLNRFRERCLWNIE